MEQGPTKQDLIAELSRSPHAFGTSIDTVKGTAKKVQIPIATRLLEYRPICFWGASNESEFYGHLLSWNLVKGQVKDSRVAMPVIALSAGRTVGDKELLENALAHVASLDPRLFARAMSFSKDVHAPSRMMQRLAERYVRDREADRGMWIRTMLQHRQPMAELYMKYHIAPGGKPKGESYEWNVLNGVYGYDSVFKVVAELKNMPLNLAADAIAKHKISPLVSLPALGDKAKDPNLLLEMIKSMTPPQLITSMKLLEKLGVRQNPMLRAALDEALGKAGKSKKSMLKTTKAAEAVDEIDEVLAEKLRAVQEAQFNQVSAVDGNWVVLGDKSGSMQKSIETARQVASILTRSVKGEVHMVFFDTSPRYANATGRSFEEIQEATKRVEAGGGTSIGCGLNAILVKKIEVDGIVLVSDGAEHQSPYFVDVYKRYCEQIGRVIPIYFYRVPGEPDSISGDCNRAGIEVTAFDIQSSADYYSLPNLIQTMRVNHYSLFDEILATPLLRLDEVLSRTTGMEVIRNARATEASRG
jgi:hypothetical protein